MSFDAVLYAFHTYIFHTYHIFGFFSPQGVFLHYTCSGRYCTARGSKASSNTRLLEHYCTRAVLYCVARAVSRAPRQPRHTSSNTYTYTHTHTHGVVVVLFILSSRQDFSWGAKAAPPLGEVSSCPVEASSSCSGLSAYSSRSCGNIRCTKICT